MSPAKCFVGTDNCPNKVNSLSCKTCRKLQEEKTVAVFDNKRKSDNSFFGKKEPSKYQSVNRRIYLRRTIGRRNTSHSGLMSKKGSGNTSHSGLMSKRGSGNTSHFGLMSKKSSSDKTFKNQNAFNKIALIKKKSELSAGKESGNEETDWDSSIENINISDDTSNSDIEEIYSVHPYLSDEEQDEEERVVDSPSKEEMIVDLLSENESVDLISENERVVVSLPEEERAVNLPPGDELLTHTLLKKERVIDSLSKDKRFYSIQNTSKKRKVDVIYPPGPSCSSTVIKIPRRVKSTQSPIRKRPSISNGESRETVKTSKVSNLSSSFSKSNIIYPPGPSCSSTVLKNLSRAKSTQSRAKSTETQAKSTQSQAKHTQSQAKSTHTQTRKIPSTSNGKSQKTVKTSNAKSSCPTSKLPNKKTNVAKKSARIVSNEVRNLIAVVHRLEQELEQLKKADTSNVENSRTSYGNNMDGVLDSGIGSSERNFVTEEDNSQLRTEIEELTDRLSEAQEKILNAKISEDRMEKKEKLMREVESLEESCKNADKLRKLYCVKYKKKMVALENELCSQPDLNTRKAKWLRRLIRCNEGKLTKTQPKSPLEPKPDRYKSVEHLIYHRMIESTIEKNEEEAAPLKEETTKSEEVMVKINDVLLDQRKKSYILSEVLCALVKKFKEAVARRSSNDFDPDSKEYDDYNAKLREEIRNLEVAATKKAEKEYEEKVSRGAAEMEFKSKYNHNQYYDLRSTRAINRFLLAMLR
ncbi:uncharacterized protein [Parasteatoda tepidariorum]|uniref:uncharacterized protein n=1 Tax=Parasteatoda tepidariorum TaxID=114398 RepID=UPI001C72055A|nr:uncharacterized protein LOC107454836 [Parasteatoda tepidariorum]XP_042906275.1 uncharacterized protein LOC107454836 [Parasteatoda tepidariorum]XP_042906276.1 uncharacterized protein LOC107454836 [Parasteatoda tepidariorum]XP_042906277.1 uncharacterized protein LOC107454836 [Parasteatoda tepidariorum]XP_042906278.1 uncharacterized protein LOC107454836 [Parasteatoda tepidariorum]XP_042906279.1 uncharacterized protein LOC107454836 [Parasteatoda tepidariorum]